jgi:hypothetical protein
MYREPDQNSQRCETNTQGDRERRAAASRGTQSRRKNRISERVDHGSCFALQILTAGMATHARYARDMNGCEADGAEHAFTRKHYSFATYDALAPRGLHAFLF